MKFSGEEKALWLEDWRRSGKSAWAYAKENGFVPQTFARWTKPETEEKSCFVEVTTRLSALAGNTPKILVEKEGMKIHIPLTVGVVELRTIFEIMKGAL